MSTPELICAKLDTLVAYLQELREYTKGLTLEAYYVIGGLAGQLAYYSACCRVCY